MKIKWNYHIFSSKTIKEQIRKEIFYFRVETLLTKEPEKIEWIDGFKENSIAWDIGPNVGTYSLYAKIKKDIEVLSFKPAAPNLYVLNRNIEINRLEKKPLRLESLLTMSVTQTIFIWIIQRSVLLYTVFLRPLNRVESPFRRILNRDDSYRSLG